MILVKNADELKKMRRSGRIAADVLNRLAESVSPGVTTGDLGEYAIELIAGHNAESAFLGYRGFPGSICVSVNDGVVHGIPGDRRISLGDIVSIDVGVKFEGFMGDTARTVMAGVVDAEAMRLVRITEEALKAGIEMAVEGRRLHDISSAVQSVVEGAGFSVVRDFVGHGIGRSLHEDPQIPNFGSAGTGPELKAGMTLCIEPMVNMGTADVKVQKDGWTVLTDDGMPSAHFEHMIAVGRERAEILTVVA